MYRRESVASANSFSPSSHPPSLQSLSILGSPNFVSLANGQFRLPPTRTVSLHALGDPQDQEDDAIDREADELFVKHSVSEVKTIQRQLRADTDAKQEELRLMVGERYRDLLQASTSIISIAQSSENVLDALDQMRQIISSQEIPTTPKGSFPQSKNDSNLQTFQSLGAHIKLLLDAPEHLWRLIERKEYFRAAWLFLLARVVHRALIHDGTEENGNWQLQGITVLDQFPLVQRQWDTVAQFRPQISHKATLSLREPTVSAEHTCATLLTLYLLDSRPLTETLSIFLTQRSRTLSTILSKPSDSATPTFRIKITKPNGLPTHQNNPKQAIKLTFKEVQQSVEAALGVISLTLEISRTIFEQQPGTNPSLMARVLTQIQVDAHLSTMKSLPPELQLSTQLLLASLPSSTHFLLLRQNIRSYIPYVDLTSSSSSLAQPALTAKLDDWFHKAMQEFGETLEMWFCNLQSMKEAWKLRLWTRTWISRFSKLQEHEQGYIVTVVDDVCRRQLSNIWKACFAEAKEGFEKELDLAVKFEERLPNTSSLGSSSLPFLLRAPTPPLQSSSSVGSPRADAPLRKYKAALRRQVAGRKPLLDQVLKPIESCAEAIQKDLKSLIADGDTTFSLVDKLLMDYKPDAAALCSEVVDVLTSTTDRLIHEQETAVSTLVLISNVAEQLAFFSPFIADLACEAHVAQEFRDKTRILHDRIIDRWRVYTLSSILREYWRICPSSDQGEGDANQMSQNYSSALTQSLLAMSTALQELGIIIDSSRRDSMIKQTLYQFLDMLTQGEIRRMEHSGHRRNLLFLQKLLEEWDSKWLESAEPLKTKLKDLIEVENVEKDKLSSYLAGTQTLLASLFPRVKHEISMLGKGDKKGALLRHGIPTAVQDIQPSIDIVKPSPRFGLLLVGGADIR